VIEYNTCDLCNIKDNTEKLIWDTYYWESHGVEEYKKIFVNEDTYQALCNPCYQKRKGNINE